MEKQKKPSFYAFYKDFNTGVVKPVNVLEYVFDEILTESGAICKKHFCIYDDKTYKRIPITTKEQLAKRINSILMYRFWSKCEWEMIIIDWPYNDTIQKSRPHKIDVYDQIKPNIDIIVDLVWNYVEPKIKR